MLWVKTFVSHSWEQLVPEEQSSSRLETYIYKHQMTENSSHFFFSEIHYQNAQKTSLCKTWICKFSKNTWKFVSCDVNNIEHWLSCKRNPKFILVSWQKNNIHLTFRIFFFFKQCNFAHLQLQLAVRSNWKIPHKHNNVTSVICMFIKPARLWCVIPRKSSSEEKARSLPCFALNLQMSTHFTVGEKMSVLHTRIKFGQNRTRRSFNLSWQDKWDCRVFYKLHKSFLLQLWESFANVAEWKWNLWRVQGANICC